MARLIHTSLELKASSFLTMADPAPNIQLLQACVDPEDESYFRLLVDKKSFKYITIDVGLYDPDDMCFGPALISLLPPLPQGDWNTGHVSRDAVTGKPHFATVSKVNLPRVTKTWHPVEIDYLELRMGRKLRSNVYEATCPRLGESTVIVKFARFHWEVGYLERETEAYEWIEGHGIGPAFLGHLAEEGRIIGFIVERVEDFRHAGLEDMELCRKALRKLHSLGIKHGDTNKHNFLVQDGEATLVDFDHAGRGVGKDKLEEEMGGLEEQLGDMSGRGGRIIETDSPS